MKILEKGPGWNLKLRCTGKGNGDGGCESLLLVEENDIYVTSHTDMACDTDYYYTICCPVCGKETDISEKDIPYSIRRKKLKEHKGIYQKVYERER